MDHQSQSLWPVFNSEYLSDPDTKDCHHHAEYLAYLALGLSASACSLQVLVATAERDERCSSLVQSASHRNGLFSTLF